MLQMWLLCFNIVKIKYLLEKSELDHAPHHIRIVHQERTYAMTDVAKGKLEKRDILWDNLIFLNKGKFTVTKETLYVL